MHTFRRRVHKYDGNHKVKSFSCLDQFLCMAFTQLTYRESLRATETCLRSQSEKLYHMGIRGGISRNTLFNANKLRDWRIYADFAQALIGDCQSTLCGGRFGAGTRQYGLHTRGIHRQPVFFGLSMGTVPLHQISSQTPYPARSAGQHSDLYPYCGGEDARGQRVGHLIPEAGAF